MACADTNRARQTAEGIRKGLLDELVLFGREADVSEVTAYEEFRNFQVMTPDGFRDVTQAFRLYHSEMEKYERIGLGGRPTWLVEVDRFWGIQQGGGDPITHWLTMPMLTFEPPGDGYPAGRWGSHHPLAHDAHAHVRASGRGGPPVLGGPHANP
jgi:hypothetical protein